MPTYTKHVTIIYYSHEIQRSIVEDTIITPISIAEEDQIIHEMHASRISDEAADAAIQNGALDLRHK